MARLPVFLDTFAYVVSAAVIVGIAFVGLAVCLIVICCGAVYLYRLHLLLHLPNDAIRYSI